MSMSGSKIREQVAHFLVDIHKMEKLDNPHLPTLYLICSVHGRVAERFKAPVLKTGDPARDRGFESHPFRHI